MRTIPITPARLTGDVLEACHRRYLEGTDLAVWAEALICNGYDSEAIIEALANPEMHWQQVPLVFSRMCSELGLSSDVINEVGTLKLEVMIEEYCHGYRTAAELLHRFDDLRKQVGFPEWLHLRILENDDDGTNKSGYYSSESMTTGPELEAWARDHLEQAGVRRKQ